MFKVEQLNEFRSKFSEEELREVLTYEYTWAITNQTFEEYSEELDKLVSKEPSLVSIIRSVLRKRILKGVYPKCLLKLFEKYNVKYRKPYDIHYSAILSDDPNKVSKVITRESDIYPVIVNCIQSTSMKLFEWCLRRYEFKDYTRRTHVGYIIRELIVNGDSEMLMCYLKTLNGMNTLREYKETVEMCLERCHSQDIIRIMSETFGTEFVKRSEMNSLENLWMVYMNGSFKKLFEYDVVECDLRETYKYLSLNLNATVRIRFKESSYIPVKNVLIRNSSFRISELYKEFADKYCLIFAIRIGCKELLDYALEKFDGMVSMNDIGIDSRWICETCSSHNVYLTDMSYKNILIHAIQNNNEYAVTKIIEKYPSMLLMEDSYGSNVLFNSMLLEDDIKENLFKLLSKEIIKKSGNKTFNTMLIRFNKTNSSVLSLMDPSKDLA